MDWSPPFLGTFVGLYAAGPYLWTVLVLGLTAWVLGDLVVQQVRWIRDRWGN